MFVSISLTVYNRKDLTQFCIETIRDRTSRDEYELIVVDNSSAKNVVRMLESFRRDRVIDKLVTKHRNNLSSAINDAWKMSSNKADWLVTLDNDNFCVDGWRENFELIANSELRPDVIFCAPRTPSFHLRSQHKTANGGTYLKPPEKTYFGAGLAIKKKIVNARNIKFVEGSHPFSGSIYSKMATQLRKLNLRVAELGKPCVLDQDGRFADPVYEAYYKWVFGKVRKGAYKFKSLKLRGGYIQYPERYYEGSGYVIGEHYKKALGSKEGQAEWARLNFSS